MKLAINTGEILSFAPCLNMAEPHHKYLDLKINLGHILQTVSLLVVFIGYTVSQKIDQKLLESRLMVNEKKTSGLEEAMRTLALTQKTLSEAFIRMDTQQEIYHNGITKH
jgi:hypothetical protein